MKNKKKVLYGIIILLVGLIIFFLLRNNLSKTLQDLNPSNSLVVELYSSPENYLDREIHLSNIKVWSLSFIPAEQNIAFKKISGLNFYTIGGIKEDGESIFFPASYPRTLKIHGSVYNLVGSVKKTDEGYYYFKITRAIYKS